MKYIHPHLSPELRAQITPANRRDRKYAIMGVFFLILSGVLVFNLFPKTADTSLSNNKPNGVALSSGATSQLGSEKQVLGLSTMEEPKEQYTEYKVKNGDTLFNISQEYNIKWDLIAQINNLSEPYMLHAGQTLKIPQATTSKVPNKIYTVQKNDTLASIARSYNVTIADIIAVNPNLQLSDLITPGQVIKLP
jgi:LysM repeat protein